MSDLVETLLIFLDDVMGTDWKTCFFTTCSMYYIISHYLGMVKITTVKIYVKFTKFTKFTKIDLHTHERQPF